MTALDQEVRRAWGWNNTRERKLKISLFTKHRKRQQRVWITMDEDRVPFPGRTHVRQRRRAQMSSSARIWQVSRARTPPPSVLTPMAGGQASLSPALEGSRELTSCLGKESGAAPALTRMYHAQMESFTLHSAWCFRSADQDEGAQFRKFRSKKELALHPLSCFLALHPAVNQAQFSSTPAQLRWWTAHD